MGESFLCVGGEIDDGYGQLMAMYSFRERCLASKKRMVVFVGASIC